MNQFSNPYNMNQFQNPYLANLQRPQVNQLTQVNGIDSARAYPTQPNSTYALFDSNEDIMYIKSTDASNFPTIRRFRFIEEADTPKVEENKYVTVEEFNTFKEEILNGKQSV